MQLEICPCLPSCAHICEEWWILEDGLNDKVSISNKAMQFNKCLIISYLSRVCHGTAIGSYASFIVSRGTRLSSIQVAARELTSLCMCVCGCLCCWCCECSSSSSRQFRTHSVRAEALLLTQLHVKQEGVAVAVHTIKTDQFALTFQFLNINPFDLMNAAQASECRSQSEIIKDWKCPQYFLLIKKSLHINVNRLLRIIIIIIYIHTR